MGQVLYKRARTTQAIRYEIQNSTEIITALAKKYGISRPTIYLWGKRNTVEDAKMGTKTPKQRLTKPKNKLHANSVV